MRTVKQVAELTGISIRTLQYYDEIKLFQPSKVTEAGYRLYDEDALEQLQQILFFKELDFQLKDIKNIMENQNYDKISAFKKQRELLRSKRDRLNNLLNLLEKLERGEKCMSFKEFDMSEYFKELDYFKQEHLDEVIKYWGSVEEFNKMIEQFKEKESEIAQVAIQQYGSIEKYTEAMKANLRNFSGVMENMQMLQEDKSALIDKSNSYMIKLTEDLNRDVKSDLVQSIVKEMIEFNHEISKEFNMGDSYWNMVIEGFLKNKDIIEVNDKIYGSGASEFIAKALQYYFKSI